MRAAIARTIIVPKTSRLAKGSIESDAPRKLKGCFAETPFPETRGDT